MEAPNISDENIQEKLSSYVHPTSGPRIINSTRSLLKSKKTIFEEKQEPSLADSKGCSSSTPPITMSFKCAKNNQSQKIGNVSSHERVVLNGRKPIAEMFEKAQKACSSEDSAANNDKSSSFIEVEKMQSSEIEMAHDGIKETVNSTTGDITSKSVKKPIETFVFFDIESTGLKTTTYKPRITELSFVAINHKDFLHIRASHESSQETLGNSSGTQNSTNFNLPRVNNKLTLCINPMKLIMPDVSDITGLDNYNLEGMKPFSADTIKLIDKFLSNLPQPACLVAHNGIRYDFPILNAEIQKLEAQNSTLISECKTLLNMPCVDSLTILRQICKEELDHSNRLMESENTSLATDEIPEIPNYKNSNTTEEIKIHVEILEETQCPSVTSTPIKSNDNTNYLLPRTPVKEQDSIPFTTPPMKKNTIFDREGFMVSVSENIPIASPSTPDGSSILIKRPKIESDFEKEIVLTTRAPAKYSCRDHKIEHIMSQTAVELQEEAFITPDKPDQVNSGNPPPPPRHSRGAKKRVVTHTNLSEVAKARKKLDFSTIDSSYEDKPPSFSLPKLYHHWFGSEPEQSHGAETDCLTLMKVCAFKGPNFVKYANSNATTLSKINKMW